MAYNVEQDAGFDQLIAHLTEVKDVPSTPLDRKLLETAGDVLVPQLEYAACGHLVILLGSLFVSLQQDPAPAAGLALKVLRRLPPEVLSANLNVDTLPLELGLQPDADPSMRELVLVLLERLSSSKEFITQLAISQRTLFIALVELWLCVPDIGAAEKSENILYTFLLSDATQGTDGLNILGPIWKAMFHDKDVYSTFYNICSNHELKEGSSKWPPNKQVYPCGRILGWLPKVAALKWSVVASSQLPEVEHDKGPLLEFAVKEMKGEDDVLAHLQWINFCSQLLIHASGPSTG